MGGEECSHEAVAVIHGSWNPGQHACERGSSAACKASHGCNLDLFSDLTTQPDAANSGALWIGGGPGGENLTCFMR
jgi:hypothetical protein